MQRDRAERAAALPGSSSGPAGGGASLSEGERGGVTRGRRGGRGRVEGMDGGLSADEEADLQHGLR